MPSLHKFLKLKAGFRATTQARLFPRLKNEKHTLQNEKPAGLPDSTSASGASFLDSFISSFTTTASSATSSGAAAALGLKHGKDRGLTASEALSRVVATPSVHGPFRQSSQPLIDASDPEWIKGLSGKAIYVIPNRRAQEVLRKITGKGPVSDDRVPSKKDSRNALVSLRYEAWKARRWRCIGSEVKEDALRRLGTEFNKNFIESRVERIEHTEDGAKCRSASYGEAFEEGSSRDGHDEFYKVEKVEAAGKSKFQGRGRSPSMAGVNVANCSQPSGNSLVAVHRVTRGRYVGTLFTRALHDVSLAGEGMTLDRSPENEQSERQSDQSAGDGKSLKLLSGACNIPHPDKMGTGGEDAYFICTDEHVIGVADGVGGWADLGIDAGEYARELMSQAMVAVHQEPSGCIDPARVMEKAHSMTKCKGSSTACILALTDTVLEAANLGDSGFVIVRNSRTVFKSPVQQHQFNIPFQLESGGSDPPSAAQVFSFQVAVGDVIVAGTDGLFDNLYDSELTTIVVQAVRTGMAPKATAQKIADLARARAQDRNRQTPFSTAAQDAGFRFYGGKMDDITVIVSYIK